MMPRPAALLCPALAAALLTLTGCETPQLPDGYAWNITTQEQNDIKTPRASYRWGFDQSRINEHLPATSRDQRGYDFASALPSPNYGGNAAYGSPAPAPSYQAPVAPAPEPLAATGSLRIAPSFEVVAPVAPAYTPAPAPRSRTHTVQKGDNYWDLSKKYYGKGARFLDIQNANPGLDPNRLQIGTEIVIPE